MGEPLKISHKVGETDFLQAHQRFWRSSGQGSRSGLLGRGDSSPALLGVLESDDALLLMIPRQTFSIVPKRDFESESQTDEFRALVERKFGLIRAI